ncbi:MAG TPA: PEGA domain-containing protein [Polyangiaceae bacterium]|jgi:hypothetical protein
MARATLAGLCLLASLVASTAREHSAHAQHPQGPRQKPLAQSLPPDAKRDYDAGKLLFEDGDYATALLKYRAAYDRTHDARLLWNVAVCQKDLRHYAKAAATLERYLTEGGGALSSGDRRDARDLLHAIDPFTVPMTLVVSEPGAEIWIDDALVGRSPLTGPISLDMGTRRLRVRKDGFRVLEEEFPVGGSAATTVEVKLERQAGRLQLHVPQDAKVFIDEREAGHGPLVDAELPVGAHAMRVVAPHMRPFQTDVLVEDGRTRALDIALDPEAAPSAEVHVAVSCEGPDPLPPQDVVVFFDDATESALPLGARIRREPGREVVAYVAFRVAPGHHTVHVASLRCNSQDTAIDVREGGTADVRGALVPSNSWLDGSPAGSPDGWRLAAGLLESSETFTRYAGFFSTTAIAKLNPDAVTLVGPYATAGLQGRWLTALVDARFQVARTTGNTTLDSQTVAYDSTLSQWSVGVRPGVRLPLAFAAISTGVGLHVGQYFFSPDSVGTSQSGLFYSVSYWGALDAQPTCEWGLQVGASVSYDSYSVVTQQTAEEGSGVGNGIVSTLWLGAIFTPNSLCERRRSGSFRIEGTTR